MKHKMARQGGNMTRVFSKTFKQLFAAILMKETIWGVNGRKMP